MPKSPKKTATIDGRTVYVQGLPVTISLTPEVRKHGCSGWFYGGNLEVWVEPGLVDAATRQTLWHEISHAAVSLVAGSHEVVEAKDPEEFYVRTMSGGQFQVLLDPRNRWLLEYLFSTPS